MELSNFLDKLNGLVDTYRQVIAIDTETPIEQIEYERLVPREKSLGVIKVYYLNSDLGDTIFVVDDKVQGILDSLGLELYSPEDYLNMREEMYKAVEADVL